MDAFTGEIRAFVFQFPPIDWMFCNGAMLQVNQYPVLFSIIGAYFGGDGKSTFQLPNIQSKVLIGQGVSSQSGVDYDWGQTGGLDTVTIIPQNMPPHTHTIHGYQGGNTSAYTAAPTSTSLFTNFIERTSQAVSPNKAGTFYANSTTTPTATLNTGTLSPFAGGGQAHDNHQPYLVFNYCICVNGLYPVRQ